MLLCRVLFRFDSVRDYSHSLDDLFESLRPAYMAQAAPLFRPGGRHFRGHPGRGRRRGRARRRRSVGLCPYPAAGDERVLPYSLSVHELGRRQTVQEQAGRIADLLLDGLHARPLANRQGGRTSSRQARVAGKRRGGASRASGLS